MSDERRGIRSRDTLTILWGYCPQEVRGALRPILFDYLWLVPSWCQTLYVRWDDHAEDADDSAMVSAQPEYRQAQLTLFGGWLSGVHASRVTAVVHELTHLPLAPMAVEHEDLAKRLLDDAPQFRGYSLEQWRRALEGAVQDLAAAISTLPGPFPSVPFVEVEDDDAAMVPTNAASLAQINPRYLRHLQALERRAIDEGWTTEGEWEWPVIHGPVPKDSRA